MQHQRLKPQYQPRFNYPKIISLIVLLGLLFFALPVFYDYAKQELPSFKEVHWQVSGVLPKSSLNAIKKSVNPLLVGNYHQINTHHIKAKILENSWVQKVVVKRPFWSKLEIIIYTHNIAMRFNQHSYITTTGIAFHPSHTIVSQQPLAIGKTTEAKTLYQNYRLYQKVLTQHFKIQVIKINPTTELIINNNTILKLGFDKQVARIKQFIALYPKIKKKYKNIDHLQIDLRYKKGVSITE